MKQSKNEKRGPGRPPKLVQQLADRIGKEWVDGRKARTKLPIDRKLAEIYGVNRRTISSALNILTRHQRIVHPPYQSAYVAHDEDTEWSQYIGKTIGISYYSQLPLNDPFSRSILTGVVYQMEPTGMKVALATRGWRWKLNKQHNPATHFGNDDVQGIIHVGRPLPDVMKSFQKLDVPMVALDFDATADGWDSICFADHEAGYQLGQRLFKWGHRRIAGVFENSKKATGKIDEAWRNRQQGLLEGLKENGIGIKEKIHVEVRGTSDSILEHLNILLRKPDRPTALYIPWDFLEEIRSVAKALKIRIPRDLTVVSCTSGNADSKLTAMQFNASELGAEGILQLLRKIRDPDWRKRKPKLVKIKGRYTVARSHAKGPQQ